MFDRLSAGRIFAISDQLKKLNIEIALKNIDIAGSTRNYRSTIIKPISFPFKINKTDKVSLLLTKFERDQLSCYVIHLSDN